jgi:hypothetical protein
MLKEDELIGAICLLDNQPEAALDMIERGLSIAGHNGERIFEAELDRLKAGCYPILEEPSVAVSALIYFQGWA